MWEPRGELPARVNSSYKPAFITYLARFLLNFDSGSAQWWDTQARGLPVDMSRVDLLKTRQRQFGQFSESVEVGLLRYQGKAGVRELFSLLRSRYGVSREGKLQLALLFSLISKENQPSDLVQRTLGEADNATVASATVVNPGRGYNLAQPPLVQAQTNMSGPLASHANLAFISSSYHSTFARPQVAMPDAGGAVARLRVVLNATGKLVRVRITEPGSGYLAEPAVEISPPRSGGRAAQV